VVCTLREALGAEVLVHFSAVDDGGAALIARVDQMTSARVGEPLQLVIDTSRLHFFEPASGAAIYGGDRQLAAA
jgi:ABC-type sugar transport system ATPase subunit